MDTLGTAEFTERNITLSYCNVSLSNKQRSSKPVFNFVKNLITRWWDVVSKSMQLMLHWRWCDLADTLSVHWEALSFRFKNSHGHINVCGWNKLDLLGVCEDWMELSCRRFLREVAETNLLCRRECHVICHGCPFHISSFRDLFGRTKYITKTMNSGGIHIYFTTISFQSFLQQLVRFRRKKHYTFRIHQYFSYSMQFDTY